MREGHWLSLAAYCLLAAPLAMLTGPALAVLPTFYVTELALAPASVGLALLLARVWDALCDPLMGMLSDRSAARRAGRMLWVVIGTPVCLVGGALLFLPLPDSTPLVLGLASAVLATGWTAIKLNHDAIASEYSPDSQLRTRLVGIREAFGLLGGILAIAILGWGLSGPGLAVALTWLYAVIALILCVSVFSLQHAVGRSAPARSTKTSWRQFAVIVQESVDLQRLATAHALAQLAAALPATLFLLYVSRILGRPDLQGLLIFGYFLCALLGAPAWLRMARRSRISAWRISLLTSACAFAPAALLGPDNLWIYVVILVATGFTFAADLILPQSILADVADRLARIHGARPAGLLYAGFSTIGKLAYALAVGLSFPLLDWAGFSPEGQDGRGLWLLALLYAGIPAVLKLVAWRMLAHWRLEP